MSIIYCDKHDIKYDSDRKDMCPQCDGEVQTEETMSTESETPETYPMPEHGWTCFHCGEKFTVYGAARDHIGGTPHGMPGCLLRVQLGNERGLQMELRKRERELASAQQTIEARDRDIAELKLDKEALRHELFRPTTTDTPPAQPSPDNS